MHKRSLGLTLFAGLSIVVAACGGGASPSPSAGGTVAPGTSPAGSPAESAVTSSLKIGVVTDIGSLDDKNYNEYTYKGVADGAAAIGAAKPVAVVPKDASAYAADVQAFIDQKYDVIVTVGFNLAGVTTAAAHANPNVWFVGVDQSPICVDPTGKPDSTFACKGDAKTLLPKYISIEFQEDQAGYLAGIIAASASKTGTIGAIGGTSLCGPCIRYIQGYELGAKSMNPSVIVKTAYVTNDFSNDAFHNQNLGKTFGDGFLKLNSKVDVLFQVAGATGNGILLAACQAKINGIGVDVDQYLSFPAADACMLTSATKAVTETAKAQIQAIAAGTAKGGDVLYDAKTPVVGVGVAPGHDLASVITPDVQAKVDAALAAMKAGTLVTCPTKCGSL